MTISLSSDEGNTHGDDNDVSSSINDAMLSLVHGI